MAFSHNVHICLNSAFIFFLIEWHSVQLSGLSNLLCWCYSTACGCRMNRLVSFLSKEPRHVIMSPVSSEIHSLEPVLGGLSHVNPGSKTVSSMV